VGIRCNSSMKLLSLYCRVTVALLMVVGCGGDRAQDDGVRIGLITPGSIANADQAALAPDRVIGSAVIDLPRGFLLVARDVAAGTFVPEVQSFGLASGVIGYHPNPAAARALPPGPGEWMDAVRDSIATGTLSPLTAPAGDVP